MSGPSQLTLKTLKGSTQAHLMAFSKVIMEVRHGRINNGLASTNVRTLAINPQDPTTLFAGTNGRGIYKGRLINFEYELFLPLTLR